MFAPANISPLSLPTKSSASASSRCERLWRAGDHRLPQTPNPIKGVINLRGKVMPVIDLRLKFGPPAAEYTQRTCIIVTQASGENSSGNRR